jgi:predicted O-methyltransferase YrrM
VGSELKHRKRRSKTGRNGIDWYDVIGTDPDTFADTFHENRPSWVSGGSISHHDARFLFKSALEARSPVAVELGTASGFSTALLCHALRFASAAHLIRPEFTVVSYDLRSEFYLDERHAVGDVVYERLPADMRQHVLFHNPATSVDVRKHFRENEIAFMFLDANHRHPWPTLDLLATMEQLRPGGLVVIHDINLPLRRPEFPDWGAKHLFDGLDVEKRVASGEEIPNIGTVTIPGGKDQLRDQLLRILFAHPWEADVDENVTTVALS